MNLCKEGVDANKFHIVDIRTDWMIAEGCTKALDKCDFIPFMNHLLGHSTYTLPIEIWSLLTKIFNDQSLSIILYGLILILSSCSDAYG